MKLTITENLPRTLKNQMETFQNNCLFINDFYLDCLNIKYKKVFIHNNNLLACSILIDNNSNNVPPLFLPYYSLFYNSPYFKFSDKDKYFFNKSIFEIFCKDYFEKISINYLSFDYEVKDLRSIYWFYSGKVISKLKYTSIIDPSKFSSYEDYFIKTRRSRRREMKYLESNDFRFLPSDNYSSLDKFLDETYLRQGKKRSENEKLLFKQIIETSFKKKIGSLYNAFYKDKLVSSYFTIEDKKKIYSFFGASSSEHLDKNTYTKLTFHAIKRSFDKKKIFDFLGANSPLRGDYKMSFNPQTKVFYSLCLEK